MIIFIMLNNNFSKILDNTPLIAMIHLFGDNPVKQALDEIAIYEEEGVNAIIVENYSHKSDDYVVPTLEAISKTESKMVLGINILPNEFDQSFILANRYDAGFIQLDHVAGLYSYGGSLPFNSYAAFKEKFNDVVVLGGVWPKYYVPIGRSNLTKDLTSAIKRAEAIVVTGNATGMPTPISKIKSFKEVCKNHPLIIGAGITSKNGYDSLLLSDGAIVGSSLKKGGVDSGNVDRYRVRDLVQLFEQVRSDKNNYS